MILLPIAAALGLSGAYALGAGIALSDEQRRGCLVSKEDAEAMKLKVEMPGLGKEHVKVWADKDGLLIEGEGDKDSVYDGDDKPPVRYSRRVKLQADAFKMDQIKAEMKDGVLKVTVPKMNVDKKRKEMFQVKVD